MSYGLCTGAFSRPYFGFQYFDTSVNNPANGPSI